MHCTKTVDEQDTTGNSVKRFPDYPYFHAVYKEFERERILFVEKSRTLMMTWLFSGIFLHKAMTRPGTQVVTISKDEDKALVPIKYQRWLWENQDEEFKKMWPLRRRLELQSIYELELANNSESISLPGKDPGKIRSKHPTYVMLDEACEMERFGESFDVALAAKPLKIVALSSAQPGDFRNLTEPAMHEEF